MKKFIFLFGFIFIISTHTTVTAQEISGKIQITGSSTCAPLVSEIAKRFEKQNSKLRIDIQTGGSSRGIADAFNGLADIGMSSRGLKKAEEKGRMIWPIAYDGVTFVLHASNPIQELSQKQLIDIYQGKIQNWKEVGGLDHPITVINRAAGRSEYSLVLKWLGIPAQTVKADLIAGENQQGLKMISNSPNAIIYISVGAALYEANTGAPIKLLPLQGIEASHENVANGSFPLSRPLILITKEKPKPLIKNFIQYAQSSGVQDLVKEFSYVSIPQG